jgi:adenylate cyclase
VSATEQRKLAAIMFTDMVGYSALSQRDDKLALELLEEHRQLLREIFPRFNGTEIKTIGDAFLVEFNSALEAAQCAIEIQRTLAKRNADAPAGRQIQVRIGVHIGDVVHRGGDVYGDGVNIASRIEPVADAGGICVSMDVERQIRNAVETRFEKLAQTELKNISAPMELFRIVLPWERQTASAAKSEIRNPKSEIGKRPGRKFATFLVMVAFLAAGLLGYGLWRTRNAPAPRQNASPARTEAATIPEKSIAVLPFDSLSEDKNNAFFTEGIQDEILTRLAKIADLKVIARTSTQKFQSAPENLPDIARQLGARNILEGSVQKVGDQVRVNVQLINALTNAHLWAEIYDRKLTDIFAVESDIAKTIADTLQAKLTGSEKSALSKKPTENPDAYQLYLKGRFFWNKRTGEDLKVALDYFQKAVAADPNYAAAYAGIGDTCMLIPIFSAGTPKEYFPKAEVASRHAIELDETDAEGHAALANLLFLEMNFTESEKEFRRAIEVNPNYATAHHWYSNSFLASMGRFDEAIAEGKRSVELDPLSLINNADFGGTLMVARRYDDAIGQLQRTLALDANFYYAHWNLGETLYYKGDLVGCIRECEKAHELDPEDSEPLALLAQAYIKTGRKPEALKILDQLNETARRTYVRPELFTMIYAALGDKSKAIQFLEDEYQNRDGFDLVAMKTDPRLDPLRDEPRFQELLAKIFPSNGP